jgi:hypothetical protein
MPEVWYSQSSETAPNETPSVPPMRSDQAAIALQRKGKEMSVPQHETTIPFTIGETDVELTIAYDWEEGRAGTEASPPLYGVATVRELRWEYKSYSVHYRLEASIEPGQLFEFIESQDCVIQACIDDQEANQ